MLFGDVNPSGRLPATFPRREADEPYAGDPEAYPGVLEQVDYKEGVFVGYRWFDEKGIEPAFAFGHGLSYTSFRYRDLRVRERSDGSTTVAVDITNTGRRAGIEVAQLYLGLPDVGPGVQQPPRALRGFQRTRLRPRQTKTVRFVLVPRDLSYWNTEAGGWRVAPGCYRVMVGASSRDIRLEDAFGRGGAACPRAASTCLARRSPLGRRGIGRVRLGRSRAALRRLPGLRRRGRRAYRYCVRGGQGAVVAALSRRGRARLVVSTARGHGHPRVRPGMLAVRLEPRIPAAAPPGRGPLPGRPGKPEADRRAPRPGPLRRRGGRRLVRKPARLRAYLRRAGLGR